MIRNVLRFLVVNMRVDVAVVAVFMLFMVESGVAQDVPILTNLNGHCFQCLCYAATQCNLTIGCIKGYCGPFKISRVYWKDAGEVIFPDDDKERAGAYEDCALSYTCAQKIVTNYFSKYGRDCNNDGVTNCDDYSMINFNGGYQCQPDLSRNEFGKAWLLRYRACMPDPKMIYS